jgi:uncharacterized protein (UPF0303 family)
MTLDKLLAIVEKQEELLWFNRFTRRDAWDLGNVLAEEIHTQNLSLAVSIRQPSGFVLFQYAPEGTTPDNEHWMTRKFNTVRDLEISTMLLGLRLARGKQTLADRKLDPALYVAGGGGFPLKIRGQGLGAILVVSGLPGLADHETMVTALGRFLKAGELPRLPPDAKL